MTSNPTVSLTDEGVRRMASRLRTFLAGANVQLRQTHAYEALAQIFGYKNWNTLKALLPAANESVSSTEVSPAPDVASETRGPSMSKEAFDEPMKLRGFELVVQRVIADERWGGYVVTVHFRNNGLNIERDDELLFRHRDTLELNVYIQDAELTERPLTDRVIMGAAVRRLGGYTNFLKHRVAEKEHFYSSRAPGALPAARFSKPPSEVWRAKRRVPAT